MDPLNPGCPALQADSLPTELSGKSNLGKYSSNSRTFCPTLAPRKPPSVNTPSFNLEAPTKSSECITLLYSFQNPNKLILDKFQT